MKSNGDTMSAFYSSLSLWIGAIFLVALTSVESHEAQARRS